MEDNYSKAYKEVIEILKYVPQESVNKIPEEMRTMIITVCLMTALSAMGGDIREGIIEYTITSPSVLAPSTSSRQD